MTLKRALAVGSVGVLLAVGAAQAGWFYQNGRWYWVPPSSPPQLVAEGEFAKPRSGEGELIVYSVNIAVWSVSCQNRGGNIMHGVPGSVPVFVQTTCSYPSDGGTCAFGVVGSKSKNTVPVTASIKLDDTVIITDDPCDDRGTPGQDKFTMVPNSLKVDEFSGYINAFRCKQGDCSTLESTSSFHCYSRGADASQQFDYDCP